MFFVARQEGLETEPVQAGADEDERDEHVGNPGEDGGHAVVNVLLDLLLGQPAGVPLAAGLEVPGLLRAEEARAGGEDHDGKRDDRADQGRELGAEEEGEREEHHVEHDGGEQREGQGGKGLLAGLVLAEHFAHDEHAEEHDEQRAGGLADGGELGQRHAVGLGIGAERLSRLNGNGSGGVGRGADRAVNDGDAVVNERHDGGAERREAEADQQRGGERGGRAEAGGAFDEGREHEAHDDRLDAAVGVHVIEHALDGGNRAGVLERVHDQDGAEDDHEGADGLQEAVQRPRGGGRKVLLPVQQGDHNRQNPAERQGALCRPVEGQHQNDDQ